MSRGGGAAVAVDLYVRPSHVADAVDDVLVDLHRMEADGVVDEVRLHAWPGRVPVRSEASDAVDRFREFRAWADRHDVSIQPPFSVDTVASEFTGDERTYLSTPVACLAVRAGDALEVVYPHGDGDEHHTVADGIEALAAGEILPESAGRTCEPDAADPSACASCGGEVVNVQGIRTCHDCRGVGRASAPSRLLAAPR